MGAGLRVLIAATGRIAGRVLVAGTVLVVGLAGCGGSSKSSTTQTQVTGSSPVGQGTGTGQSSLSGRRGGQSSVATSALRATLRGENHAPVAGTNWEYTVRAMDSGGKPLSGTVDTEFTFGGTVVGHETPATHQLKNGQLTDTLTWPKQAVGQPLNLQTVVHTSKGSVTLDWPVTVRS